MIVYGAILRLEKLREHVLSWGAKKGTEKAIMWILLVCQVFLFSSGNSSCSSVFTNITPEMKIVMLKLTLSACC